MVGPARRRDLQHWLQRLPCMPTQQQEPLDVNPPALLPPTLSCCLTLKIAGSFVSGLYMPQGDLDLSIEGRASW